MSALTVCASCLRCVHWRRSTGMSMARGLRAPSTCWRDLATVTTGAGDASASLSRCQGDRRAPSQPGSPSINGHDASKACSGSPGCLNGLITKTPLRRFVSCCTPTQVRVFTMGQHACMRSRVGFLMFDGMTVAEHASCTAERPVLRLPRGKGAFLAGVRAYPSKSRLWRALQRLRSVLMEPIGLLRGNRSLTGRLTIRELPALNLNLTQAAWRLAVWWSRLLAHQLMPSPFFCYFH
jgi:hypothetical protein